jgi:uncharacterized membrane protein
MPTESKSAASPIFSKTYDLILWLLNHTEKFPKSERFRLARRLEDAAFDFYDLLVSAARSSRRKAATLLDADLALDRLRFYVRLSHARGLFSDKQYEYAAARMVEIGKLLGGWLKSISSAQAGPEAP